MREEPALVLDERDEEAAAILTDLGMVRHVARSLVYLAQVDEALSKDLEQGADLRQPEVSMAMQDLRDRGWVSKRDVRTEGKGRPLHCYKLERDLDDILDELEAERREELEALRERIDRLREIARDRDVW